jgi:hypothetical protein
MTDPIPPGEQAPLRRFPPHAEMTMGNAVFQRTADINRGCAGVHAKKFFTGMCQDIFWNRRFGNLTENLPGVNFSKNGSGIFQELPRTVKPAHTGKSTLSVNCGPQFAKNQSLSRATQTTLRGQASTRSPVPFTRETRR